MKKHILSFLFYYILILSGYAQTNNDWRVYTATQIHQLYTASDGFWRCQAVFSMAAGDTIVAAAYNHDSLATYLLTHKENTLLKLLPDGSIKPIAARFPHYINKILSKKETTKMLEWVQGKLLLYTTTGDSLIDFDIKNGKATCSLRKISQRIAADALALHPQNGLLYTIDRFGVLYEITPATGFIHVRGKPKGMPPKESPFVALWFSSDGLLWGIRDDNPDLWLIDVEHPAIYNVYADLPVRSIKGDLVHNFSARPSWLSGDLLHFTATSPAKNAMAKLSWAAANDAAVDYYVLEKSKDNYSWQPCGDTKNAIGIEYTVLPYGDIDRNRATTDTNFYRILRVEKDRYFSYSHSIQYPIGSDFRQPKCFVSPSFGKANRVVALQGYQGKNISISVRNAFGAIVHHCQYFVYNNDYKIDIPALHWGHGWHFISITDESQQTSVFERCFITD